MTNRTAALRLMGALAVATGAVAMGAGAALAQIASQSKSPIDITADQAEVNNAQCTAIWKGAAEAVQDNNRLRADTLTVYSRPKPGGGDAPGQNGCGGVDRIEANGHVYYVTPTQNARGDRAVYTQAKDEIVITGDVIVVQGQDVARGDKLTLNVASKEATMVSDVTGAGKPGRVRAVVYPDRPGQPAGIVKR